MKIINNGTVLVCILASWIISILSVFAQDPPLAPVPDLMPAEPSLIKTAELSTVFAVTGKVHVVRDDDTYKVMAVNLVADGGKTYNVLLDGQGKNLVKVLKSRIVKVIGELKEHSGKSFFIVHSSEIIGTAKKLEVVATPKVNSLTEPKPESRVEAKPEAANESNTVALTKPATNVETRVEIKPVTNAETKTNAIISVQSNSVPPVSQ